MPRSCAASGGSVSLVIWRGRRAWTVPDVYLLTEGPDGTVAVPNLTLLTFR